MNKIDYHNFDLKKPLNHQNDLRTASYRGHRYIRDPPPTATYSVVPEPEFIYSRPPRPADVYKSEQQASYKWKTADPDLLRNPRIELIKVRGMKDLDAKCYTAAPKAIDEFRSVTNTDYNIKPSITSENQIFESPEKYNLKPSKVVIDPALPGSAKYLDMMATTNLLNYHSHSEIGLAQNDIITLWNWIGESNRNICSHIDTERPFPVGAWSEELCAKGPANICPRRRAEFPSSVKHVPYSGLTSEIRDNYVKPTYKYEYKVDHIKPIRTVPHKSLVPPMGMNKIYGSGEPVDKFVSIKDYNKLHK